MLLAGKTSSLAKAQCLAYYEYMHTSQSPSENNSKTDDMINDKGATDGESMETVDQPAKVMRIGMMVRQLLEEVRQAPLDEASRLRMKEIYQTSVDELGTALSPELSNELNRLSLPFEEAAPSEAELRVAQAQLVGWLEGLFHGIQASLVAQQIAARAQLEEMRGNELPPGSPSVQSHRPGTYL